MTRDRLKELLTAELRRNLVEGGRPRIPAGGDLMWRWFLDINRSRSLHAGGPNPVTYAEIEAYARLHLWPMQPHHVEILFALDRAFIDATYQQIRVARDGKTADGVKVLPPRSQHSVTPGVFDAIFG